MNGLSLAAPAGLALLGLLAPLVVLYILKVQRRVVRVPSAWLWQSAKRDHLARAPFKRFVAQLPLILQAIALVLLALAFARPTSRSKSLSGSAYAVVLDESASMLALVSADGEPARTRFDEARDAALAFVRRLPADAEVLVVAASRDAKIASPLERDTSRLEAAITRLEAEEVEGDVGAAVGVAVDRLRPFPGAKVVLFTDGNFAREPALDSVDVPVEIVRVGDAVDNVAVIRVDATNARSTEAGERSRDITHVFAVLANYGSVDREVFVTLREENASDVLDSRRLILHAGEKAPVILGFDTAPGDFGKGVIVDVSPHDRMPVDDVAYARIPEGSKLPVVLASNAPSPWLERALSTDEDVELRKVSVAALSTPQGIPRGIPRAALVVVEGACPADDAPGGDLLVVHPPPGGCLGLDVGAEIATPVITSWETGDPRLRFLTLDGVSIAHATPLTVGAARLALVRAREGTLIADASSLARTATVVGFDVGESDWPLKASFVLFVRNVVEQAAAHRTSGLAPAARTGEPLRIAVPPDVARVEIQPPRDPSGTMSPPRVVAAAGAIAVVPSVTRAGVYRVSYEGATGGTSFLPVNLASAAESDLRRVPAASKSSNVEIRSADDAPPAYRSHAWWIALVALAFALLDVWYYTRLPKVSARRGPRAPLRRPVGESS